MGDTKSALQSRTVWAGIVGIVVVALDLFGVKIGVGQEAIVDAVLKIIEGVAFLAAIFFRITATKTIERAL